MRSALTLVAALSLGGAFPRLLAEDTAQARPPEMQQAARAFHVVARKMYAEILKEMSEKDRNEAVLAMGCDEKRLADRMAQVLLQASKEAFELSPTQAAAIVAGTYDDRANQRTAEDAAETLGGLGVSLPRPTLYLIEKVRSGAFKAGIDLEFAARFLAHQVSVARQAAANRPPSSR
ncbi:MAG TPA: hypothetical protein VMT52_03475 [Planctomycetota bacterium]|nr:hypothetical protein [Planctomycetota bacterium]